MKFSRENILTIYVMYSAMFLAAIRWRTGTDWDAYLDVYENIKQIGVINELFEPGFIIAMKVVDYFGIGFSGYIIILSVLCTGIKLFVISRLPYWKFALVWYGTTFQFDLYSVRYNAALSFLFLGLFAREYFGRRWISWIFFSFGMLWHKAVLIGVLLSWPRKNEAFGTSLVMKLLIFLCLIVVTYFFVTQESFQYKLANQIFSFNVNLQGLSDPVYVHRILYLVLCVLISREMSRCPDRNRSIHAFVPIFGGVLYCIIGVVDLGSVARLYGVFLIFELYIVSAYNLANRKVILLGFAMFVFPVRVFQYFSSNYFDLFWPYETILEIQFKGVY
ncbi:EpsG family protein [Shimia sp. MMG029]|uniref:EpsG family protein n=1 Tax=Shimia sp. MMG029 TaxID=3021978 RepID=UPI003F92A6CC